MVRFSTFVLALAALAVSPIEGKPTKHPKKCKRPSKRKAWHNFSTKEKKAYINAELCLMNKPATLGLPGATNMFEEFQSIHHLQSGIIHGVGAFLPYHRLLIHAHETVLRKECRYKGAHPYWDVTHDAGNLANAEVFDPVTGFGGNGVGESRCIADGPFKDYVNTLGPGYTISNHCITRWLNDTKSTMAGPNYINACYERTAFVDAWRCLEAGPHFSGHGAVGGLMTDSIASPGDPIFYLHHAFLDKVWWEWQAMDLPARLTDMGGTNVYQDFRIPPAPIDDPRYPNDPPLILPEPWEFLPDEVLVPGPEIPPQVPEGDPGDETTLDHILRMLGVFPDATIRDVMDIQGGYLCYEYV